MFWLFSIFLAKLFTRGGNEFAQARFLKAHVQARLRLSGEKIRENVTLSHFPPPPFLLRSGRFLPHYLKKTT